VFVAKVVNDVLWVIIFINYDLTLNHLLILVFSCLHFEDKNGLVFLFWWLRLCELKFLLLLGYWCNILLIRHQVRWPLRCWWLRGLRPLCSRSSRIWWVGLNMLCRFWLLLTSLKLDIQPRVLLRSGYKIKYWHGFWLRSLHLDLRLFNLRSMYWLWHGYWLLLEYILLLAFLIICVKFFEKPIIDLGLVILGLFPSVTK